MSALLSLGGILAVLYGLYSDQWKIAVGGIGWILFAMQWKAR